METTGVGAEGSSGISAPTGKTGFNSLGTEQFLQLLITELQNQDPMQPMENSEMVQQLNQIWQIQASQGMTESLGAVTLGQNMATATALLGQNIIGLDEQSDLVNGLVERVTIEDGSPMLHVGEHSISLKNVSEVFVRDEG
jgi:flagellar basal-body rod modification protein FlgD